MALAAQVKDGRRSIFRIVLVIALAIYGLARFTPEIAYYWLPKGDFGIVDVYPATFTIKEVAPHSAAADAGLHIGDRIDTKYVSLHEYLVGCCGSYAKPGETMTLHILRGGEESAVTLVARPVHMSAADIKRDLLGQVNALLRILLGVVLVLLRPGRMTWLFYLWMLSIGSFFVPDYFHSLPAWLFVTLALPYIVADAPFATLFCLVFPNDKPTGWRRQALPLVVASAFVFVAVALVRFIAFILGRDTSVSDWIVNVENIVGDAIVIAALITSFVESRGFDRQRVRWVVLVGVSGFFAEVCLFFQFLVYPDTPVPAYWTYFGAYSNWLFIIAVAYAILRYRMFDVEFVVSRALVYSLLAAGAIGAFAAIDAVFTSRFHGSKAEVAVDIALALGIGFGARAVYGQLVELVDRTLFRRRYQARIRLMATLDALADANSQQEVETIVTSGAASALGLASAAFFRRMPDGGLLREVSIGWPPDALWHLLPDDRLVVQLQQSTPRSIDLYSCGWSRVPLAPPQQPVLAVPMVSANYLVGVTFYGSRLDGVLPSPDEVGRLVELARRAANTYRTFEAGRPREVAADLATAH